ncbi:hypothetical protein PILCRDRAFT_157689 [Piloderma croceum F 1598]|uniref:C3H1-type domain-containing protein n=1 Tax=Piloderma croceum (strain F 1598) TaxID=765440 RepID=A0A0C3G3U1_PILCF|nr:hypothetical protein PILCRDRAFT_157689 [Piloderma croceum F 1598]
MESRTDSHTDTMERRGAIDLHLNHLIQEISGLLTNESLYCQRIEELSTDLQAFKAAYTSSEKSKREVEDKLQKLQQEFEKDKHDLENQIATLKGSERRVICLVDGDGAIFSPDLLAKGQEGGLAAAKMLAESVRQDFSSKYQLDQFHLWVYVFYNKRGLVDAIGRAGLSAAKQKFEDFVFGFNQAAERFVMVDVGSGKEAADAKIKVILEDNIRLPQTNKILFGGQLLCNTLFMAFVDVLLAGCHDNGYTTSLRSLITAGFQNKLVLLRGYTESATGIDELGLPSMTIPQLFIPDKLNTSHGPLSSLKPVRSRSASVADSFPQVPRTITPLPSSSLQSSCTLVEDSQSTIPLRSSPEQELDPLPFATETVAPPTGPQSYKSALQAVQQVQTRASTPELDAAGSSASSDTSYELLTDPRGSPSPSRARHVNPNIPLSKHKPPPCTLFYLANCKHGIDCKYGHDYILEDDHYETIRENAKKAPCPAKNRNEICTFGDSCCYGHVCPLTTKCHFNAQGRCKFRGTGMHKETSTMMI